MSNSIIKDVLIIGLFACLGALYLANRDAVHDMIGLSNTSNTDLQTAVTTKPDAPAVPQLRTSTGTRVTIKKSPKDGQFWTDARVNGRNVHFLVDTGAAVVALTLEDAKKAGINTRKLEYTVPVSTAGGQNMAAAVTLKYVAIGSIKKRNVSALVIKDGLHVSLLGMSYLGTLQKVEARPDRLILKL